MRPFKFLTEDKSPTYIGNIYEEMIVAIYKYCGESNEPFIGYEHTFTRRLSTEVLTIVNFVHNVTDGILFIDYDLTINDSTYRHVFRIPVYDFERVISR
jgi:hypothetical protein